MMNQIPEIPKKLILNGADWDEDFEPSPVRSQRHRSSPSKPAGRRAEREDNHLYEDEIARMRSRKRQPDSRKRTNKGRSGSRNSMKKKKSTGKLFAGIGILLVLIIGVLFVQRWWKLRDGFWNIAVFGVDSRSGSLEKGALSDVEIICSINKKTNEIRLVSVYRIHICRLTRTASSTKLMRLIS